MNFLTLNFLSVIDSNFERLKEKLTIMATTITTTIITLNNNMKELKIY